MANSTFKLVQLQSNNPIPFDCGDEDLNDYFAKDWHPHFLELMAVTYCLYQEDEAIAMFSLFNDRIDVAQMGEIKNSLLRIIPNRKRYKAYPAVKIGRLGVRKDLRKQGIGTNLLDFLKAFFLIRNKTGCRFLTVDSYPASESFYRRNGFRRLTPNISSKPGENVLMVIDLMPTKKFLDTNPEDRGNYERMIRDMQV